MELLKKRMDEFMLRREKDVLADNEETRLPSRTIHQVNIELQSKEKNAYEGLFTRSKKFVDSQVY